MEGFHRHPMLRIALPLALGICCFVYYRPIILPAVIPAFLILLVLNYKNILFSSWKHRWVAGAIIYVTFFLTGHEICRQHDDGQAAASWLASLTLPDRMIFKGEVKGEPQRKGKNTRMVLVISNTLGDSSSFSPEGLSSLAYIEADTAEPAPVRGDILLFRASPEAIPGPGNPGEFDFRGHMAGKNIHLRCFVRKGEWKVVGHQSHPVQDLASACRDFVYLRMAQSGVEGSELALVAALLLGMTDDIEPDVKQSYSATGAMHVLSVSGLHVGIIYMVLNFLLKGFSRMRYGEFVRFILILSTIWFYSLVAGLSASVLRASLMFSFLQVGKLMKNQPPALNTLAASAFILLLVDPLVLTQIGFQFSYLAVVGILVYTEPMQAVWKPENGIAANTWSLLVVSVAAQIATGPLSIHYFGQFPILFLLTNLMVIPLTSVTMYLALMVLAIPMHQAATFLGILLTYSLRMMTGSVRLVQAIPGSLLTSISLPSPDTLFLYFFIFFISIAILNRSKQVLIFACGSLALFLALLDYREIRRQGTEMIIIYSLKGYSCIDYIHGKQCTSVILGEDIPGNTLSFSVQPNRTLQGIKDIIHIRPEADTCFAGGLVFKEGNSMGFNGFRIFIADSSYRPTGREMLEADLVVVSGGFRNNVEAITNTVVFKWLIIEGSVPAWKAQQIEKECAELKINCHPVNKLGCFQLSLYSNPRLP